jgi:hypothetical protein
MRWELREDGKKRNGNDDGDDGNNEEKLAYEGDQDEAELEECAGAS